MKNKLIFSLLFVILSCQSKEIAQFQLIDKSESGIDFINQIEETDSLNILEFEYIYNGGGVGIGDFNNDGLDDIFFSGNQVDNRLYLNKGDLRFQDISEASNISGNGRWNSGVSVVDINADGLPDIYVCATFIDDKELLLANQFFINQGPNENGIPTFVDRAPEMGLAENSHSTQAAFLDYDLDGDLDVYVLTNKLILDRSNKLIDRITDGSSITNDHFFRNNGNGTFTKVSKEAGITNEGFGLGIAVMDVNHDRYPDLYISNDFITNDLLYINQQDGTFRNEIDTYLKHQSRSSMGNDVADLNQDGHAEIITLDMLPESNKRVKQMFDANAFQFHEVMDRKGYEQQYTRNTLQWNQKGLSFTDIGQQTGISATDWSWSVLMADYDNDMRKDILISNGYPMDITDHDFVDLRHSQKRWLYEKNELLELIPEVKIPNYAFRNLGEMGFEDVSESWGFNQESFSNGAAFSDLDNDGDLDFICNNIDDVAFLYENQLANDRAHLKIKLSGLGENPNAIGAKVYVRNHGTLIGFQENYQVRGYLSSVSSVLHFGLDTLSEVDEIEVLWPNGESSILQDVVANQLITIDQSEAYSPKQNALVKESLFREDALTGVDYLHQEKQFQDFRLQALIPTTFSQEGAALTVTDLNGDGLDDLVLGNARGFNAEIYIQSSGQTFVKRQTFNRLKTDLSVVTPFDADGDGDVDLYFGFGSNEIPAGNDAFKDELWLNNGSGFFLPDFDFPSIETFTSAAIADDFDHDGDHDLLITSRMKPAAYPLGGESYMLINENGKFTKTDDPFEGYGMIADAVKVDLNGDGWQDVVVVGEWNSPGVYVNNKGKLTRNTTDLNLTGWWRSISVGDLDGDGDQDLVLGNQGENHRYPLSKETPMKLWAKDFDSNGTMDPFTFCYTEGNYYPIHLRNDVIKQVIAFRRRFPTFADYGSATMDELLLDSMKDGAIYLEANEMRSVVLENLGNLSFAPRPLPMVAQTGPVMGTNMTDLNGDGMLDLILVGNDYGAEVFNGRQDAFRSLVLHGDGKLNFIEEPNSGFRADGDAKAIKTIMIGKEQSWLVMQNQDSLKVFKLSPKTESSTQ